MAQQLSSSAADTTHLASVGASKSLRASAMKLVVLAFALLVVSLLAAVSSTAEDFGFFYFVQQWPGSLCDRKAKCCYPDTGKPAADFGIHGLWPNYAACDRLRRQGLARAVLGDDDDDDAFFSIVGRRKRPCWPQFCNDDDELSTWEIRDLLASLERSWPTLSCGSKGKSFDFWSHEWQKHGTCSNLEQHEYFERALALKAAYNLTAILADAGIVPSDTETYSLSSVSDAIAQGTGFTAKLQCNRDADNEDQLYQVYMCVDKEGKKLIDCPLPTDSKCPDEVKLPIF